MKGLELGSVLLRRLHPLTHGRLASPLESVMHCRGVRIYEQDGWTPVRDDDERST
jgi:hypothetical protein